MHYLLVRLSLFLLFINFLLFISCKKEEENNALPVIELYTPASNSFYLIGDTIHIKANVFDDEEIISVSISLKGENNVPVLSESFQVRSRTYALDHLFPISKKDLSGRYYIDVTAYDGMDRSSSYRYINIGNEGKSLSRIFVFTPYDKETRIWELKNDQLLIHNTLKGDFNKSAISLTDNKIYSLGEYTGDLNACDTSGTVYWNYSNPGANSIPFFNDIHIADLTFASMKNGDIIGFGSKGSRYFEKNLDGGYQATKILRHEDQILFEQVQNSNGQRKIVNNFYPSASFKGDVLYNYGEITAMFTMAWNKVLIVSNDSKNAYLVEYDSEKHYLKKKVETSGQYFSNVLKLDDNSLLFFDGSGLSKYLVDQEIVIKVKDKFMTSVLRYNPYQQTIFGAYEQRIFELNASTLSVIREVNTNESILSLELYFEN